MSRSEVIALVALIIAILGIVNQWFTTEWQVRVMKQISRSDTALPDVALKRIVAVLSRWFRRAIPMLVEVSIWLTILTVYAARIDPKAIKVVDVIFVAIFVANVSLGIARHQLTAYTDARISATLNALVDRWESGKRSRSLAGEGDVDQTHDRIE